MSAIGQRVSLFATCLVDAFYPRVGQAVVRTLERFGFHVTFPADQTCCGLPFYNNGYRDQAAALARKTVAAMRGDDPIAVPSGSCAWMMRNVYPELLPGEDARMFSARVVEYSQLLDRAGDWRLRVSPTKVTYHPSCHLLRGLGVEAEPKRVLGRVEGLVLCPMDRETHCCGFGGTFSVRFPEVSGALLDDKLASARRSGAERMVVTDAGCMLQLDGGGQRAGAPVRVVHLAEVLDDAEGT